MIQISLQQVSPIFLEEEKILSSSLWNRQLTFSKGEKIQLIAPSGSGKSSLIHFLYGLRKDYTGNIFFDDKNITTFNAEDVAGFRSRHLSIVFQDLRLFADHTAYENIQIKKIVNPFEEKDTISEMAGRLGIKSKLNQLAGICSYGEQQRIAIIRALQQPFDFLILDEPFSHLDKTNNRNAMELIEEEAQKRNAGILMTDLEEVEFFKPDKTIKL